jgi:hypothetical protein
MQKQHIVDGLLKLVWWYWACELLLHYLLLWVHIRTQSRCCPHTAAPRKDILQVGFSAVSIKNKNELLLYSSSTLRLLSLLLLFVAWLSLSTMVTLVQCIL